MEGKVGKEMNKSSRLEFLETIWTNNFSDPEHNISWPSKKAGIADLLLLRILLAIRQKFTKSYLLGSDRLFDK